MAVGKVVEAEWRGSAPKRSPPRRLLEKGHLRGPAHVLAVLRLRARQALRFQWMVSAETGSSLVPSMRERAVRRMGRKDGTPPPERDDRIEHAAAGLCEIRRGAHAVLETWARRRASPWAGGRRRSSRLRAIESTHGRGLRGKQDRELSYCRAAHLKWPRRRQTPAAPS